MKRVAIIAAAGSSRRFGERDKLFEKLGKDEVIALSVAAFQQCPDIDEIVVAARAESVEAMRLLFSSRGFDKVKKVVTGGELRSCSVRIAIDACDADIYAIHDGARPLVSDKIISETLAAAEKYGAAAPALALSDTLKHSTDGFIDRTVERAGMYAIQTPQVFRKEIIVPALQNAPDDITDDCLAAEMAGARVFLTEGERRNIKITSPQDVQFACSLLSRGGVGYDAHRLVEDRKLILGGVEVPFERGLAGHSDADVLLHAVTDAILGAAGLGDIGKHFPDSDARYEGISSLRLLSAAGDMLSQKGFGVINIDSVVVCQRPKLASFIPEMEKNIARTLGISASCVCVKATTEEGMGFTGLGEGIAAWCCAKII